MKPILLYNGNFITFAKRITKVDAVLVTKGLIKKIFSEKEERLHNIRKINLGGNYVIPGFIDCHTHLVSKGIELQRVDLEKCTSLAECLEKLHSALHEDNEIVFGSNWDESKWTQGKSTVLNKNILDKISKKKPIIMRRICGHFAVVNTKALNLIPPHWRIVNRVNGYLYEDVCLNLNEIFTPSEAMLEKGIDLATTQALANGITSIHEITFPHQLEILQKLNKTRRLKLRVAMYILLKYYDNIASSKMSVGSGDDFLKLSGIKIFVDGSIGARTAATHKPYRNTNNRGKLLISMNKLNAIVRTSEDNGIQLMVHSLGDRATSEVLNVLEKNIDGRNTLRHRLEHIEMVDDTSVDKIAKMNLIASMQPNFVRQWQMPGGLYEQYLGKRYKKINCFKKLLEAGVKLVFGSDCMPIGPLYGIQGAVKHPFSCGRLTSFEAFKLYTREGAYAAFDDEKKGTIETGKYADLVVLDKNPLREKNPDRIKILKVFVGGNVVYRNVPNENR